MSDDQTQLLREIRKACTLKSLTGNDLDLFCVETDIARDPEWSVRDTLRQLLEDSEDSKILFCGHGGSGKSTELNKLVSELDSDAYLVVGFSILPEMQLTDVNSEDIILVLMERLAAAAENAGLKVDLQALKGIYDYFASYTKTEREEDAPTAKLGAGAKASTPGLFESLLKLLVDFKAEVRYDASNETTRVAQIRKRPGVLMNHANLLINAVQQGLPPGKRLLFIVENLDKLEIAIARHVFIEKPSILTGLNASNIYTIPIFIFHSPEAGVLTEQFQQCISLPMIKTLNPDGTRAEGFEIARQIVLKRLGDQALTDDAMNLLIEKTGGVLRHVFEVISNATFLKNASVPLREEQIQGSLLRKRKDLWTTITLPYEPIPGLECQEQLYARLRDCSRDQRSGRPCRPSGLPIDQVLLKSCALIEYNGEGWLGVHPLVQEILDEI
ncbi:MAG: hypothetical protein ACRER2_10180 [Methylococcales bacterium]